MQRLIVTSATYRQSSRVTPGAATRATRRTGCWPAGRGSGWTPRWSATTRWPSAACWSRRSAGRASSRTSRRASGRRSATPSSNTANFKQDHGDALYRRSLYTFWKRTAPPPTLTTLDAPSRETCTVRRARTNTPLAALALMNDVQFVEAARHLAERMMTEGGDDAARIGSRYAFRLATARQPDADGTGRAARRSIEASLAEFQAGPGGRRRS